MNKIGLEIVAISHSVSQSHNYAVILAETGGLRRLPIVIGGFEAQGIAIAVEKMTPNRPLTHDLFKATLDNFSITIKEVIINDLLDGIFYAQLICEQNGDVSIIDSRTSDAIAMAVRFDCPIYTYEFILDQAGVEMENEMGQQASRSSSQKQSINKLSMSDLEIQLEKAIEMEDYEKAAKLRDEISKRKDN
ncbi:MAG: hypothetical protein RLZZ546_264 [Bacteroidota bacterium]|jgi:bifunctional DNase/RNase